jgi:YD repeat-containing protein
VTRDDGAGELASVTVWNNQETAFSYDNDGNLMSTTYRTATASARALKPATD